MAFLRSIHCYHASHCLWLLIISTHFCGCALVPNRSRHGSFCSQGSIQSIAASHLAESRRCQGLADQLIDREDESCVDWYFAATRSAWYAAHVEQVPAELRAEASSQYHLNLKLMLCAGQKFGRFDPRHGLRVNQSGEKSLIPVEHRGFPWESRDFQWFVPPPEHLPQLLSCRHTRSGCGVTLVMQRCRNNLDPTEVRFFPKKSSYAATVLLRFMPHNESSELNAAVDSAVLEFHDPLHVSRTSPTAGEQPLAADLTAPLAESLQDSPRTFLAGFVQSGSENTQSRLTFVEPYQAGKTPLVFIHGLFSDPQSWADMENDLRAIPGFCDHFQIWFFRYPTGQGFLRSAAELRSELQAAIQACDPSGNDPGLQQMVLVGHSMGGLIAKLQVTHSENAIWRRLANKPLQEIRTDPSSRAKLSAACFFDPAPHVRRVIFIATPHRGANEASGLVGNVAARLVRESPEITAMHRQLIEQNPGVFADVVQQRLPTSIDLLKPESPLLAAMGEMKIGCGVKLHNIMGETPFPSLQGPSDGVVPISSALHDGCCSELIVSSSHTKVHRAPETVREINRILVEHRLSNEGLNAN